MKKFLLSIVLYVLALVASPSVHASGEFTTTFNSLYTISESGETNVTHTITLKNNLAHIYATNYTLATSGDHVTHITASDDSGPLSTTTSNQDGTTTIHFTIEHPAIGKDKEKVITLNYQTTDVVEIIGNTTTINIPRLSRANEAESYTRIVKVRGLTGQPTFIYPPQNQVEIQDPYTVYTFVGHGSDSLTLLFGDSVTYALDLTYELKNKDLVAIESELALPPDTGYQKILLDSLVPPPLNIRVDQDGNWLARYSLRPQEKLGVKAKLYATVYPEPKLFDPSGHTFTKSPHSKYWDVSAPVVSDLAAKLKTPENIYGYLTSNFTYNYAGVTGGANRLGASHALISPSLVLCTEFTDTFVALARSSGVPAREINGYGYTTNTALRPQSSEIDVLHAWPEYYDEARNAWIAIDPTWGNTTGGINYFNKLDFSHITFVRHGLEDSYPLPAGAYKDTPNQKFVEVAISVSPPAENSLYEIQAAKDKPVIHNIGNVALINESVELKGGRTIQIPYLPPYGIFEVPAKNENSFFAKLASLWTQLVTWVRNR